MEAVSAVLVEEKADRNGCMEEVVRRHCLKHHLDHGVGSVVADDFLCYLESAPGVSRTWHRDSSCSKTRNQRSTFPNSVKRSVPYISK